ncbi:threonine/serine ThrE exporter family protein [Methanobacterium alcaliphilum]|uniref:threonine/serine ThrE exporter family protein n=1 Tax=Methanobacterium alcaliphilum TaxID=392018 RepID=UPI002009FF4A|nr:threonine/serine exporter family protein [Methanobacterium alcaliphilum]MCK9150807.1 threonine/serine exporter family protein [Methanobacterium alcaliphilum]
MINTARNNEIPPKMLKFLKELSKSLIAAGSSVTDTEDILENIANAHGVPVEVSVFPTMLLLKLGDEDSSTITIAVQSPGILPLNQVSEIYRLIHQVENHEVSFEEALLKLQQIRASKHHFGKVGIIFGYFLLSLGLGLLIQPSYQQLMVCSIFSIIVGLLILVSQNNPRLSMVMPVIAAFIVSSLLFFMIKQGIITGNFSLLIPSLIYFLPGVTLTTGIYELARGELVSGSSRVIYGTIILFLLIFGLIMGVQINGFPQQEFLLAQSTSALEYTAPYLGVLIFGIGMYLFLSVYKKDFLWILLVLYVALIGQQLGNMLAGGLLGGFLGALFMTISAKTIESHDHTPHFVTLYPAFWFLAPGSIGFIGLADFIGQNYLTSVAEISLFVMTIIAIALGLLVGAIMTEPLQKRMKKIPV